MHGVSERRHSEDEHMFLSQRRGRGTQRRYDTPKLIVSTCMVDFPSGIYELVGGVGFTWSVGFVDGSVWVLTGP
jgi:hypothetical protein